MSKAFYLTTTLPYVNADPHIGFALELVQADAYARFRKSQGDEVFFNTGTDEHGQKIWEAAEKAERPIQEYVDYYANEFKKLGNALGLSEDLHFIRTTNEHHIHAAQKMWDLCKKDIYKKEFEGLYCVGCEKFLTQREIVEGKCHIHGTEPKPLKEENYFFRLSGYQEKLLTYLSNKDVIIPDWRREEAINFVKEGLEDVSISRQKDRLSWGIPVSGDDSQVMYVWFEALVSYISTLGWPDEGGDFKKFWKEGHVLQMAGKDQVRFQSIMWQAMLLSAGIKNTDQVFYHGFINSGGQKMSKSLGNVIDPYTLINEYGTDAVRYYLLRHMHPFDDSDFTMEKFKEAYNADLANGIGNVAARIMQLAELHLDKPVLNRDLGLGLNHSKKFQDHINQYNFMSALETVFSFVQRIKGTLQNPDGESSQYVSTLSVVLGTGSTKTLFEGVFSVSGINQTLQTEQPFKLIKREETKTQAKHLIEENVKELAVIALSIQPFMPATSHKILEAIYENKKPENLFPRKE